MGGQSAAEIGQISTNNENAASATGETKEEKEKRRRWDDFYTDLLDQLNQELAQVQADLDALREAMTENRAQYNANLAFIDEASELLEEGKNGNFDRDAAIDLMRKRGESVSADASNAELMAMLQTGISDAHDENEQLDWTYDKQQAEEDRLAEREENLKQQASAVKQIVGEVNAQDDIPDEQKSDTVRTKLEEQGINADAIHASYQDMDDGQEKDMLKSINDQVRADNSKNAEDYQANADNAFSAFGNMGG